VSRRSTGIITRSRGLPNHQERGRSQRVLVAVQHQIDGQVTARGIACDDDPFGRQGSRRQQPVPPGVDIVSGTWEPMLRRETVFDRENR